MHKHITTRIEFIILLQGISVLDILYRVDKSMCECVYVYLSYSLCKYAAVSIRLY